MAVEEEDPSPSSSSVPNEGFGTVPKESVGIEEIEEIEETEEEEEEEGEEEEEEEEEDEEGKRNKRRNRNGGSRRRRRRRRMMMRRRRRASFTVGQLQEMERQALIYKYMATGVAVPIHLILPIWKSVASSPVGPHRYPSLIGLGNLCLDFWSNTEPEPGRCRRTDGKKWRCSRNVVPDQKYCDRHMHRGRIKKPHITTAAAADAAANQAPPENTTAANDNNQTSISDPAAAANVDSGGGGGDGASTSGSSDASR